MITQQAARRRRGRAIRKSRRLGLRPRPTDPLDALRHAVTEVLERIREAAVAVASAVAVLAHRLTPILHNGRKYHR